MHPKGANSMAASGLSCEYSPWLEPGRPFLSFCLGTEVPRHSAGCVGTYVRTWYVAFRNAPAQVLHALHML